MIEKFKFRTMRAWSTEEDLEERLNELGRQGFTLAAVVASPGADGRPVWVFQRPFNNDDYYES